MLPGGTTMAELTPYPVAALVRRMFRELERNQAIFDLPARAFVRDPGRDLRVGFHGHRVGSHLSPAAGPRDPEGAEHRPLLAPTPRR